MTAVPIGVDVNDLRLPLKEALRLAAGLEFRTIELPAGVNEVTPSALSSSGRRHLSRFVDGLGLSVAALSADMPDLRLTDPRSVDERVERTRQIIDLARDLRVTVVTASVGALTHPDSGEPSPLATEALRRIGEHADARGVVYAVRPSYDNGDRLARVLSELRCPSIRVGLDPAAMVMRGVNPLAVIERLGDQIALLHARDATVGFADRPGRETPLGQGEVDLRGVLLALDAADYHGAYIVRRTDSRNPTADLQADRDALRRMLPQD